IRFNNLNSQWDRSRQAIRVRLTLADKFLAVLRRIREDEYQQNLLLERMHQLEGIDTSITSSDLAGSVGMEGPDKLRSEVTLTISRLEDQQTLLRDYIDQVTQRADRDLNTAEPVRYCQLQLELNARRLEQLRESWVGCERFWEQWKMAREYWLAFNEDARLLDDSMAASLSRMSHAPLPNKPVECDRAMREHHKEREDVDHLSSVVLSRAAQLGSMIGVRPDDRAEDGRGWRLIEIPVGPEAGLPASALGRRVRSELALQLAGLETRWSAWDKAWATRRIQLERRGLQVGRLSTIEELEGEVAKAEDNLQAISKKVSVQAPLEQVEQAERDLNQLEATIPVLQNRVRSTAPGLRMELIHGEPCDTSLSELPFEVTDRYQQLSTRFDKLADSTTRCRVELNLTLRLLRAVKVADNALSQLTISLNGAKKRIHEIPPEDRMATQQFRSEIEEQLVRGQALADMHIPTLEQLAAQHPRTVEARERIQPTVLGFASTIDELQRVSNEIRIRSEQSVYLIRPTGTSLDSDTLTTRLISPASPRPSGPVITKPLRNMFTDEGITVLLTTEFQSGLPPDANPYDQQQLQATWFKDGQQVATPDYESRLTPTTAELRIGETLSEDTGLFTCCIRTPYGQAETSCNLVVNETHSPVSTGPVADESVVRPSKRARASRPPGHMTEPPRFVRELTSQTIREPEELNLQCQAVGEPVPKLHWFKDGTSIQTNPDYMITELAGAGSVKVRQTRMVSHEGTYTCRAKNVVGEAVTKCRVTIHPGSPPIIVTPLRDKQLVEGEKCQLTVRYKSSIPATVEWYHDGRPVRDDGVRCRITQEGSEVTNLTLPKVTNDQIGDYMCVVRNLIGEASTNSYVQVHPTETPRTESPIPLDELLDQYRSRPPERPPAPKRPYDLAADFDEVFEPQKTRKTFGPSVAREDLVVPLSAKRERIPSFPARRHPGEFPRATSVPVTEPSVIYTLRKPARPRPSSMIGEPPIIVQPLKNADTTDGEKIKMDCIITGHPPPTVTWYKNGVLLPQSNSRFVRQEGDKHSLIFCDILLEDQGEYTCVAENPYGQVRTSCHMDVEPISDGEQPVDRPPELVKPLPTQMHLHDGSDLRLECIFSGRPTPSVIWLKDGTPVPASPNFQPSQDGGVARLYVPRVQPADSGVYRAVATNPFGSCRTTVYLQILPKPISPMPSPRIQPTKPLKVCGGPEFTRIFKDIYIESQRLEEVVLECTVIGVPQPTVYWTHNGLLITGDDQRYVPVQGPGPDDHCLIIRRPDIWAAGRYQAVAENIHGRATCSAVVNPVVYSPTMGSRPPSLWSLSRSTRQRAVYTRETSVPVSPAATAPPLSPRPRTMVQVPTIVPRLQRETSAPPSQQYLTSRHLQLVPGQTTPPIQVTFPLPRERRSLSRSEITHTLEPRLPEPVKRYSSTQYLSRIQYTRQAPTTTSTLSRRVSSQPRLEPGYSSEEEHEHPITAVPYVRHYKTRMERSLAAKPRLRPGYRSEMEHKQTLSVTPMVPEYRTTIEQTLPSVPRLKPGFATEVERPISMDVVPVVPEYKTQLSTEVPARPQVQRGFSSEREYIRSMSVTPMVPEYETKLEHKVVERPVLEAGYASEEEHEHAMNVVPLVRRTEYKTELATEVPSRPTARPGFASETTVPRPIEVTPMTTEYKTRMERRMPSYPILEAGYSSEEEYQTRMEVVPVVPHTSYRTEMTTDLTAKPVTQPGFVSEQQHMLTMEVVPVVPEFKTELSTEVHARPQLTTGHETRLDYERQLQWETELKQYQSAVETRLPSRPSLTSVYSATLEHETSMNVVPVVPYDERFTSHFTQEFAVEYRPVDLIVEVPVPPQFIKPLASVMASEGTRVVLDGIVTGTPQPSIAWFKAGRQLEDGPDLKLEYNEGQVRLTLTEAFVEDAGQYVCEAQNVAGQAESSATIVIQARLMAPYFVKGLESQVVQEGQSVRMVVKVDGEPPPTVTWTYNGREIISSPHYKIEVQGDGVHVLEIPETYFQDTGRYTVIAKNAAGESVSSGLLTMQEPEHRTPTPRRELHHRELTLQVETLPQMPLPPPPPPSPKAEKPQFTQTFLPEMELPEDDRLVLTVEAWGNPLPFIHWFHNGRELMDTPDLQITQVGPPLANPNEIQPQPVRMSGQLIISRVLASDSGLYTCVAVNQAGQAEVLGNVSVLAKSPKPSPPIEPALTPPKFIQSPPFSIESELNQPLVLTAEAVGNPIPDLRVYHNGVPVLSDINRTVETVSGTGKIRIQVHQFQPTDQGDWTFVASNSMGTTSKTIQLAPRKPVAPEPPKPSPVTFTVVTQPPMLRPMFLQRLPENLLINEENPITLRARFTGQPNPTVQVLRDGKPLEQSTRVTYALEAPDLIAIHISKPRPEDDGVYTVCIENPAGKDSCSVSLNVVPAEPPPFANMAPPRFIRGPLPWPASETGDLITCPGQLVFREDQPVNLEVEVTGEPVPTVTWFCNSKPIPLDGTHKVFSPREYNSTLLLDTPNVDTDSGTYTCVATNAVGQAALQFNVHIKPSPPITTPPRFTEKPPEKIVTPMGKPLTLNATVEGTPNPTLSWYRNGLPISSTSDGRIIVETRDRQTTVRIAALQPEDLTDWECVATNIAGTASSKTTLTAEQYQETIEIKPKKVEPEPQATPARAPRFTQFLQPVTVPESSPAKFFVSFEGEPAPQVSWFREEIKLDMMAEYKIVTTVHTSELTIEHVSPEQAGTFSVVLTNIAGQACSKSRLLVEKPPQPSFVGQPPKFESRLMEPVTVKIGEPVTFECKVTGEPVPQVYWERNGVRLPGTESAHVRTFDQPPYHTLVLCAVSPEDAAEYTCVAVNPLGQDTCKARVYVEEPIKPAPLVAPVIFAGPKDVTVMEAQQAVLVARVKGTPTPEVTWLHNGEIIKPSSYFQPTVLPNGEVRLVISSAYLEDAGDYTVQASNPAGETTATARLTVQRPLPKTVTPRFTKPLPTTPVQLTEGMPIQLTVEFVGEPQPEITWLRNGQPFQATPDWTITTEGQTSTLGCREVFVTDSAEWTVEASNSVGRTRTRTQLTVIPVKRVPEPPKKEEAAPVFEKRLQPRLRVPLHHTATLHCVVSGHPEPIVRWFHNGTEFYPELITTTESEGTSKHELLIDRTTHSYTLYIHDLNAFDIGEIMVRAENELGVTVCQTHLEMEIVDGQVVEPRFLRQPPERVQVSPGEPARLECEVESQPPVAFRWYLDGMQLDRNVAPYRVLEDTNRTTLIIPRLEPTALPTEVKVEAAAPTGTKIVSTSVIEMMASTAEADRPILEEEQHIEIPTSPLRFVRALPRELIIEDNTGSVFLDVEVEQPTPEQIGVTPKPVFTWYRNGIELFLQTTTTERYQIVQENTWHNRLIITNPGMQDIGELTCIARRKTKAGEERIKTSCQIHRAETGKPTEIEKRITETQVKLEKLITVSQTETFKTNLEIPPKIIHPLPTHIKPTPGTTVKLEITVTGHPQPDVQWTVSSPQTSSRCEIVPVEEVDQVTTHHQMLIHDFKTEDYRTTVQVVATSEIGQATSVCQLEAPAERLEFTKTLSPELEVAEATPVLLECAVQPTPTPVDFHWYVQGVEVTPETQGVVIQSTSHTSQLHIEQMRPELAGPVTVQAVHPQGQQVTCTSHLIFSSMLVLRQPESPVVESFPALDIVLDSELRFSKPLSYELVRSASLVHSLVLECQIETEVKPVQVIWTLNDRELTQSDRVQMVYMEDTGTAKLIVHDVAPEDAGQYACIVKGQIIKQSTGKLVQKVIQSTTEVEIFEPIPEETTATIEPLPQEEATSEEVQPAVLEFVKPVTPELKKVSESELQLDMECQIQADLATQTVKWLLNGQELVQSDRIEMSFVEDLGVAHLTVHHVSPMDSGEYTCQVVGRVIEPEKKKEPISKTIISVSEVTITEQISEETTTVIEAKSEEEAAPEEVLPALLEFVKPVTPQLNKVSEQELRLDMECQIHADITPQTVKWLLNGQELIQSDRVEMSFVENLGLVHLTIHQVAAADSGEYSCEVTGEVIEPEKKKEPVPKVIISTSDITIEEQRPEETTTVLEPVVQEEAAPEEVLPTVLEFLKPVTPELKQVSEKELQLDVECQIQADIAPQTVQWLLNGQELTQSDRVEISFSEDIGVAHLTVYHVGPADSGEYTCRVVGEIVEPAQKGLVAKTITSTSDVTIMEQIPQETTTAIEPVPQEEASPEEVQPAVLEFVKPVTPELKQVSENELQLDVECQIHADITPQKVEWLHNGRELVQSDRVEMSFVTDVGVAHLTVHQVSPLDSGAYTCKVLGEVIEPEKHKEPVQKTIISTSDVIISVQTVEETTTVLEPAPKEEVAPEEVKPAVLEFVKPLTPEVKKVSERELKLDMECQIQADIAPQTVQWLFNGQELVESNRIEMSFVEDLGLAHLTVHQVGPADSGEYACKVTGEVIEPEKRRESILKTIVSTTDVTITEEIAEETTTIIEVVPPTEVSQEEVKPTVLEFVKPVTPELKKVSESDLRLDMECQIHADITPQTVQWLHDGQELVESDRVEISFLEDLGVAHLTVHQVGPTDSGEYSCKVVGQVIEPKQKELVPKTIISTSDVTITEEVEPVTYHLEFIKPLMPEFHAVSDTQTDLELTCQIQTNMEPLITEWILNDTELVASDRLEMCFLRDQGVASLTVHQVSPSDSGDYTCVVTTQAIEPKTHEPVKKSIKSTIKINIEAEAEEQVEEVRTETVTPQSPTFLTELKPVRICEGEEIYLTATVRGTPQPLEVTWKHDGVTLQPDTTDAVLYYAPDSGVCELTISEAFPEDAGVYSIEASNQFGLAVTQTEVLIVKEEPDETTKTEEVSVSGLPAPTEPKIDVVQPQLEPTGAPEEVCTLLGVDVTDKTVTETPETRELELFSPIEVLPQLPDTAYCEHYVEEKEIKTDLEEPVELPLEQFSDEEQDEYSLSQAIVLDVLIPHDAISVDEVSFTTDDVGKAVSVPSLVDIAPSDVQPIEMSQIADMIKPPEELSKPEEEDEEQPTRETTTPIRDESSKSIEQPKYIIGAAGGADVESRKKVEEDVKQTAGERPATDQVEILQAQSEQLRLEEPKYRGAIEEETVIESETKEQPGLEITEAKITVVETEKEAIAVSDAMYYETTHDARKMHECITSQPHEVMNATTNVLPGPKPIENHIYGKEPREILEKTQEKEENERDNQYYNT
ncbi:Muscle M-line assembly protein unc-89, partial [Clonorchis sinensis]